LRGRGNSPQPLLLLETVVMGITGALGSQLLLFLIKKSEEGFLYLLADYRPPRLPTEGGTLTQHIGVHGLWWVPIATTLGGLVSGLLIAFVAQEVKGHGTDKAIRSYHKLGGFIRARVPVTTLVSASAVIGSGGSAGREGPIISISGGIGSVMATWFKRPEQERNLLLLVGMASGLSAIYRAPIGGALFGIEALYGTMEFETGALIYTMIASVVAWIVNAAFVGWHPIFTVGFVPFPQFYQYCLYIALGIMAGVLSTIYPWFFYSVRDGFNKMKLPIWSKPAIGGLCVGLIAVTLPQVLGGGYGWMQMILDGRIAIGMLIAMLFAKIAGLALTVGSGGTGGVFAPSLFIGACLGASFAHAIAQAAIPFIIIGMAAVFGTSCRTPLTGVIIILEMTSAWSLLPATALAVWVSYMVQVRLSLRLEHHSLYEEQVHGLENSPAHYAEIAGDAVSLLRYVPDIYTAMDARALLRSDLDAELALNRKIETATLPDASSFVGKRIDECYKALGDADWEILGVLRGEDVLLPFPNLILHRGDRIAMITSPDAREQLRTQQRMPIAA
jgi:CIC family chloride channel protein